MPIWYRVVSRLEENVRRVRWRIFARKMNRFAGTCLMYAYRSINPRRDAPLFEHDWPAGRTPPPEPWDDYNWDCVWGPDVTGMPGIGNGASSCTQVASHFPPHPPPVGRRRIVGRDDFCDIVGRGTADSVRARLRPASH